MTISTPRRSVTWRPDRAIHRFSTYRHLHRLLIPFLAIWATGFILLIRQQYYIPTPEYIGCTASPWDNWPPDVCGINATDCATDLVTASYRCPGACRDVTLGNPRWVGGEQVNGVPFVVGGNSDTYRADSWICPAAIHANMISPRFGGCVTVDAIPFLQGASGFLNSTSNGITSSSFLPHFPGAFTLTSHSQTGCIDLHAYISTYNALCLAIFTLFLQPSTGVLYSVLMVLGYAQIKLVSNPPTMMPDWSAIAGDLPAVLGAVYWIWHVAFKRTLKGFKHLPLETTLWQGLGYWIGVESSTIFAKLPISRLGYDPLDPAGVITLTIIVVLVVIVVVVQVWDMRKYGTVWYYLIRYLPLVPIVILLATLPGYYFRPHHYLLSLLALPVLSLPNRVSLFLQAFFLGLFLDGVGRWGWDSIIETKAALLGDADAGTGTPTFDLVNSTASLLSWDGGSDVGDSTGSGVGVMIDDVLREWDLMTNSESSE
ncbi:hypothetical protein BCR39DRAFT_474635 [Naematelia encephala]|uniref:LCCL domain-containing protein n=1 Tax=Naematelia encephala TaxID=71784 RepID=A0A1Y2AEY2_9TREE|nr:hypothetical protein BCR39DRAFT_474635 [Naematelia encephala]